MSAPVLRLHLEGLSLGGRQVLGTLDLAVSPGETLVLTGPSGIGKTSLLRVICGLEPLRAGRIDRPDRIAMVFQEPTLLPWRTAVQNLTITTGIPAPAARAALEEVGLGGCAALYPGQMSLGQQRRLALARAFACDPQLLLMDEPFVSLDPDLVAEMMTLFRRLRDARSVATILVTHVEAEARALATRILRLSGTPAVVTDQRPTPPAPTDNPT